MKYTISDIRAANKAAGFHFFDRSAMRFFDSRVERMVYQGEGGVYFLTSEQFHGSNNYTAPRKWTVRKFNPETGDCGTVRQSEYNTLDRETAISIARSLAKSAAVAA